MGKLAPAVGGVQSRAHASSQSNIVLYYVLIISRLLYNNIYGNNKKIIKEQLLLELLYDNINKCDMIINCSSSSLASVVYKIYFI